MPVTNIVISLEEHSAKLNGLFKGLPLPLSKIVDMTFKLWETKKVCPDEYPDELFSSITEELMSSPILRQQIAEANRLNDDPALTPTEVADKMHDVAASKVHLAITALERPLALALIPFIENGASVDKVELVPTLGGVCFVISLVSNKPFITTASRDISIYESWRNRARINNIVE